MAFRKKEKDFNYFECFVSVAQIAKESADYLNKVMVNFDVANIEEYAQTMHRFENAADLKKHVLSDRLIHEFMPPISREDISLLSQELDNMVDLIEDVMRRMYMFRVESVRAEAIEFSVLISQSCEACLNIMKELVNFKKSKTIKNNIIEVNSLENKGDNLHARSIRGLFSEDIPATDKLVWTMIYESLENSLDTCEDVADLIESIVTKNT